jgi:GxxExxY protein
MCVNEKHESPKYTKGAKDKSSAVLLLSCHSNLSPFRVSPTADNSTRRHLNFKENKMELELYESGPGYSIKGYNFNDGTSDIIRCALEVHKILGPGFREIVYQRALALEFEMAGIRYSREEKVPIYYKSRKIDTRRADFIVEQIMLEIKAKREFDPEDYVQALNYVKASNFKIGLLLNFGTARLQIKRLVN